MRWRTTGQRMCCLGLHMLAASLLMGCDTAASGAGDTPKQAGMPLAGAGEDQLTCVTLRMTGMS